MQRLLTASCQQHQAELAWCLGYRQVLLLLCARTPSLWAFLLLQVVTECSLAAFGG
jgi:hypothetical protein